MDKKPSNATMALILFLLAALVRLAPVIAAREMTIGLDDMFHYDMLARSLAAGDGFRWYGEEDLALVERYIDTDFKGEHYDPRGVLTSFRPPGYPFFLSLIYRMFGLEDRFFIARIAQALVMAMIAPLTYLLARRLFPGNEKTAWVSGVMVALYPYLLIYPLALATEVIFVPLVLGALLALLKATDTRRWQGYLLPGILLGMAALTRSVILLILPFILLWLWLIIKDRWGVLIVTTCVLACVIPWSARNTRLHGTFTSIENNLGYTLYMGYHPETGGRFQYPQSVELIPYLDDAERNRIGMEKARAFILDDPGRVPGLMLSKLGDFFGLERRVLTYFYTNNFLGYLPRPGLILLSLVFTLPFAVVMIGAVIGLVSMKWTPPQLLIGAVLVGYIAPHLLLLAEPRFHLTIVPLLAVLAAHGWTAGKADWPRLRERGHRWKLVLAAVLIGLLLFNWGFELWQDAEMLKQVFGPDGHKLYLSY